MNKKYFKKFIYLFSAIFVVYTSNNYANHAITHNLGGARFGDKVMGYLEARYLSYTTNIPFLYRSFIYSNQLDLSFQAYPYDHNPNNFSKQYHINSPASLLEFFNQIRNPQTPPTLYILDYYPAELFEWNTEPNFKLLLNIPWNNPQVSLFLKECIKPTISVQNLTKENVLNVAMHVRTLSGSDTPETSWKLLPLKHPSYGYFERQIQKVYEWNLRKPMYVFIFSDTNNPQELLEHFRSKFVGSNIEFNIQALVNPDLNNTVQDFFAMQQFNVLIATQSNFSMSTAKLGNFDMVIYPLHVRGNFPTYYIDQVRVINRSSNWLPYDIDLVLRD